MILIVGLGNPGLKFRKTRHNIGFMALDALQKENNFPKFKLDKKSKAEITKGVINNQEILLAKPQTYMNTSGFAVKTLTINYKLLTNNLLVIHDDFDLPFGEVKIVENSGSGGHHGVESIIQALGTKNFKRLKIGIRPNYEQIKAENFVLKKFSKDEQSRLAEITKNAINQLLTNFNPNPAPRP